MTIDDLKIRGAKLPNLNGTIKCRVIHWEGPDQTIDFSNRARYSFGTTMHNDIQYILAEEFHYSLSSYYMIPTTTIEKLAIEQGMISKKKTEEVMKKHEITRGQLKEIHDVACNDWKERIEAFAKRNPFGDMIEFTLSEIAAMFKASDNTQIKVLEDIFGKQIEELNFVSNTVAFKVDGIDVFGISNMRSQDAFIGLPREATINSFFLNPNYNWEIDGIELKVTRK